jgi:hypothetical protein
MNSLMLAKTAQRAIKGKSTFQTLASHAFQSQLGSFDANKSERVPC